MTNHATSHGPALPGWLIRAAVLLALGLAGTAARGEDRGAEFFERKIRPVLVEHCESCHSSSAASRKKLRGGLRLDSREAMLRGGDSGPAVVPGRPDESPLLAALRYDDAIQMPPKGKLPDAVIADFAAWIAMGAPDPRVEPTSSGAPLPKEPAGRDHWAYQPPRRSPAPEARDRSWPRGEVDAFLLARLEAAGLKPAADADRATLLRRLSFDLTGLPPTPEEIDAFIADPSPLAYERLVDRLLASPRFGERWGRHWLDVARFAESLTLRGFVLKEAWRYRDYVIDAFNADEPLDQFLREQIAGDLLPAESLEDRRRQLTAASFLVLGNTNLEEQDKEQLRMDVVDEQLDTIGKAFLAQTIGCARCHDHKFDPIPTADYYALAGIFRNVKTLEHANVSRWLERPLPAEPEREAELARHEEAVAELEARIAAERKRQGGGKGVVAVADVPGVVVDDDRARRVGSWKESQHSGSYIGRGYLHDDNQGKGEKTLTFSPELPEAGVYEVRLAYSPGGSRAADVPVTVFSADGEAVVRVDMRPDPPIDGRFVSLGRHRFERNGQGFVLIATEGTNGHVTADAVQFLRGDEAAAKPSAKVDPSGERKTLEAELKRLKAAGPARETVLSVFEEPKVEDARIHVRGSVHNLGATAPRGVLSAATIGEPPGMPTAESGRRELAEWIASPANTLTARVFVNRAWHWLFGAGLVRTVDNFGTTGEPPSDPELLDHLALGFLDDGWSVKRLVRRLVLSRAYQLASTADPRAIAADPENRLFGRMHRRRLDAECLRDAMLAASGRLDGRMGGPSFPADLAADYGFRRDDGRRSVYQPVFRNALPELFEAFDFADPSTVVGRRDASTVAPQALFLLNHPFPREQARAAAQRLLDEAPSDDAARLDRLYLRALGRRPTGHEQKIALAFLDQDSEPGTLDGWAAIVQSLFASFDFRHAR